MKDYRTTRLTGAGDFIASVSGSGTDFDITLDDGTVLEEFNPDATFLLQGADPVAGDLCTFGILTGDRLITVANAQVIPAAMAAAFWRGLDLT